MSFCVAYPPRNIKVNFSFCEPVLKGKTRHRTTCNLRINGSDANEAHGEAFRALVAQTIENQPFAPSLPTQPFGAAKQHPREQT
jgi:hypothetical protein